MIRDAFLHGSAACLGELLVRPLDRPLEHPCPYVVAVTRRAVPGREDEVVRLAVIRARLVRLQLVEQVRGEVRLRRSRILLQSRQSFSSRREAVATEERSDGRRLEKSRRVAGGPTGWRAHRRLYLS